VCTGWCACVLACCAHGAMTIQTLVDEAYYGIADIIRPGSDLAVTYPLAPSLDPAALVPGSKGSTPIAARRAGQAVCVVMAAAGGRFVTGAPAVSARPPRVPRRR
jgi:hypothetical protein